MVGTKTGLEDSEASLVGAGGVYRLSGLLVEGAEGGEVAGRVKVVGADGGDAELEPCLSPGDARDWPPPGVVEAAEVVINGGENERVRLFVCLGQNERPVVRVVGVVESCGVFVDDAKRVEGSHDGTEERRRASLGTIEHHKKALLGGLQISLKAF
jgi:hypothetical protein